VRSRKKTEETRLWLPVIYRPGRLADLHAALEKGAITNTDVLCNHIPDQGTFTADFHTIAGIDIAANLAQNHHFTGRDIRLHLCIAANGDPLYRYLDGEMRERLTGAIYDLPERERLIMTRYYYEETTMKEIGLSLGVVGSRLSDGRLRARLAAATPPEEVRQHTSARGSRTN
jgi:hypothetical protein